MRFDFDISSARILRTRPFGAICRRVRNPGKRRRTCASAAGLDSVVARDAPVDARQLVEIRQAAGRDFVWFDHGNAEYVVTDPIQAGLANRAIDPVRRVYRAMQRNTVSGTSVISWITANHEVTLEHRLRRAA